MKKTIVFMSIGLAGLTLKANGSQGQKTRAEPLPAPSFTITLGGRDACVTPCTQNRARADGGTIDVQTPSPSTLTVAMTGTPAADSFLGCTSTATQTFQLTQEFEIACSDPSITRVCLTLDSTLAGYVRSMRKAGACVSLASASVSPASWTGPPLALDHPPLCASGTEGRLCNQHLPPVQGPPMPLGHYTLVAFFELDTIASGVCNAHAVADFSVSYIGRHGHDLAHGLVTQNPRKLPRNVPARFVHVGVTNAAGVHLHQNLIRAGLRLGNILHLPRAIHSGYDGSLHIVFLPGRFDADVSAIGTLKRKTTSLLAGVAFKVSRGWRQPARSRTR